MNVIQLHIPASMIWDDTQLWNLCAANKDMRIERNPDGTLEIMSPAGGLTGNYNFELNIDLGIWNRKLKLGYSFDSSTGFIMPNGAMRSPDAAWIEKSRWESLSKEEQRKFPPICPDFIIELRSPTDPLKKSKEKMEEWIENGCRLAWLIDPSNETAYIYRQNQSVRIQPLSEKLLGEDVLPEFVLNWNEL